MENNSIDLTVIIPIHKLETDLEKQLFVDAVDSVFNQKNGCIPKEMIIITTTETKEKIQNETKFSFSKERFIINDETSDNIQSQINKAVKEVKKETKEAEKEEIREKKEEIRAAAQPEPVKETVQPPAQVEVKKE